MTKGPNATGSMMTFREISGATGMPISTVHRIYKRALQKLQISSLPQIHRPVREQAGKELAAA